MSEEKSAVNLKTYRQIYGLFFLFLTLFYLSFTSGTIEGQGYNQENLIAANQVATDLENLLTGNSVTTVAWTRHGCLEPLFELPFVILSHLIFGNSVKWAARFAILQPILATSLLCTILFIWCQRLTGSLKWGYLLAIAAGLATMLWPYSYIGLETTQSLALLAAAFLSIGRQPKGTWAEVLLFGFVCATAVSVKLNGVFLAPAVSFLLLHYFWRIGIQKRFDLQRKILWVKFVVVLSVIFAIYAINTAAKSHFWQAGDAGISYYSDLLVDSPLTAALQAFSYFGSLNKSLFLFCPILLLSFVSLGAAYRQKPDIVIFALLSLAGLIGGFSVIWMWAEETWGPRYLHATIAPLVLCLGAAKASMRFYWLKQLPFLALMSAGIVVSLLGSFHSYTRLHQAAIQSSENKLEALQYDPRWNHLRFNATLVQTWLLGKFGDTAESVLWPPANHWWFSKPVDAPVEKTLDLREFATPQPILVQDWRPAMQTPYKTYSILRIFCVICLAIGIIGLAWLWRVANRLDFNAHLKKQGAT